MSFSGLSRLPRRSSLERRLVLLGPRLVVFRLSLAGASFKALIVRIQKIFIYLWASPCFSVNLGQQKLDKVRELLRSSAFTSINDPPHKSHILNDLQLIYKRYIARLDVFILLISTNHMPVFSRDYPQNSLQSNTKRLIVLPPRKRGQEKGVRSLKLTN